MTEWKRAGTTDVRNVSNFYSVLVWMREGGMYEDYHVLYDLEKLEGPPKQSCPNYVHLWAEKSFQNML